MFLVQKSLGSSPSGTTNKASSNGEAFFVSDSGGGDFWIGGIRVGCPELVFVRCGGCDYDLGSEIVEVFKSLHKVRRVQ